MDGNLTIKLSDEHRPYYRTFGVTWQDETDGEPLIVASHVAPVMARWIIEAFEHIYHGEPRPTCEPYNVDDYPAPREAVLSTESTTAPVAPAWQPIETAPKDGRGIEAAIRAGERFE